MSRYAVLGAGSWGTALAAHVARCGHQVTLWCRRDELAREVASTRRNDRYLPGVTLPSDILTTSDLDLSVSGADTVLTVVPSRYVREVLGQALATMEPGATLVLATKGFDAEEQLTLSQLAERLWQRRRAVPCVVLSGPSFARETATGQPTALVAASASEELARRLQVEISHGHVRVYRHDDVLGVELGGALKNVIALAAGMLDGLGMGANPVAALITRGLHEMTRLGVALGGRATTFSGLSGMGDLVLTCTDGQSRNFRVGREVAKGRPLDEILAGIADVPEGPWTVGVARSLARDAGIEMPITEQVHAVLYGGKPARDAVDRLLGRRLKAEH